MVELNYSYPTSYYWCSLCLVEPKLWLGKCHWQWNWFFNARNARVWYWVYVKEYCCKESIDMEALYRYWKSLAAIIHQMLMNIDFKNWSLSVFLWDFVKIRFGSNLKFDCINSPFLTMQTSTEGEAIRGWTWVSLLHVNRAKDVCLKCIILK